MNNEFKSYRRKGTTMIRKYVPGEDLSGVSVSETDDPEKDQGYIGMNPNKHEDKWYISTKWFNDNYELAE